MGEKAPSSDAIPLTAVESARAFGVDISLLVENLRLTPKERLERAQEAARSLAALQTEAREESEGDSEGRMIAASFEAILERLAKNEVDFIVIGGLAAALHGPAYVTKDIDVCYGRSQSSIEHLCRGLPALIRSKRSAGRPKDMLVVPELEALLETSKKS